MSVAYPNNPISRDKFDAVLFDLDGVLTATAKVHAVCWKTMFDEYLQKRATEIGEPFRPFEIATDYTRYVDGKPRVDGVRDFLHSRGIQIAEGTTEDPPSAPTIHGLGNRKNEMVHKVIESEGVETYEGSIQLVHHLRHLGIKTAVVSASHNCQEVLKAAKIANLFDARVDGAVASDLGLPGKPEPDTFLEAAKQLGVEPKRAVVVEDALSGVQAGITGGFGFVIGVARKGNADELKIHGAHLVVNDLGDLLAPAERMS